MRESTVISITNSKGGVGKTTTALNLGAALAAAKKRVLLIDNDPQGNLTAALGYTPGEQKNTLAKLVLVQIDSPEDLDLHLPRTVIHTETGIDPPINVLRTLRPAYRSCSFRNIMPPVSPMPFARR